MTCGYPCENSLTVAVVFRTLVPVARFDRSSVSPAGTAMLSSTISEHAFLLALALAAEVKVQVEALFNCVTREGDGAADARVAPSASREIDEARILKVEVRSTDFERMKR